MRAAARGDGVAPAARADDCTALAAAFGARGRARRRCRRGVLAMVAEAVVALGYADLPACERPAAPATAPHAHKRRRT